MVQITLFENELCCSARYSPHRRSFNGAMIEGYFQNSEVMEHKNEKCAKFDVQLGPLSTVPT